MLTIHTTRMEIPCELVKNIFFNIKIISDNLRHLSVQRRSPGNQETLISLGN
jgi:hypothetical protein